MESQTTQNIAYIMIALGLCGISYLVGQTRLFYKFAEPVMKVIRPGSPSQNWTWSVSNWEEYEWLVKSPNFLFENGSVVIYMIGNVTVTKGLFELVVRNRPTKIQATI
uniref:Uncharacterized protein n=1 Tax=candidate division WWE3 bacterium TaxID=2053526 RepID=A0A7C4XN48_UNCKA